MHIKYIQGLVSIILTCTVYGACLLIGVSFISVPLYSLCDVFLCIFVFARVVTSMKSFMSSKGTT